MPVVEENPLTGVEERHATYTALLQNLTLASDHRENLLSRGLTQEEILQLGYKTTPVLGFCLPGKAPAGEGPVLSRCSWFLQKPEPVDAENPRPGHPHPGAGCPGPDPRPASPPGQCGETEVPLVIQQWIGGGLRRQDLGPPCGGTQAPGAPDGGPYESRCDHFLTGQTVLAVAGVNSLSQLKPALEKLQAAGMEKVMTAFDMDYLINPHVRAGQENLAHLLDQCGISYGTYLWDPRYKGLDDYIWGCLCGPK